MSETAASTVERHSFEAEVSKLLHLMVHSVYSDREIFLRELISNASDACDRLRYEAITNPELIAGDPEFRIRVTLDEKARTITVSDNGIGMDHDDLIAHLGTIARSGTAAFAEALSGDKSADLSLIGQFGVGFYASFMVAEEVRVTSRRAGSETAHVWESSGDGTYEIRPANRAGRGTDVLLRIKKDAREFLDRDRLEAIVRKYSNHIAVPITLAIAGKSEEKTLNEATALWARPKSEITQEQYTEFYRHVAHALDEPALVLHNRAEGRIAYTALLFVPGTRPLDLFDPARKPRVKLHVRRVFISEDSETLLPGYLRFLRGVVDSEDLPLNISREMLQSSPVIARMGKAITNKLLAELAKLADREPERYAAIWDNFGAVLKEGLYEDADRREQLLKLARFRSTHGEGWTSLADYVARMKEGQEAIYYLSGDDPEMVRRSPQLEGYRARGLEVLLLADPVDAFWLTAVTGFEGKPFRSVTRGAADLAAFAPAEKKEQPDDRPREGDVTKLVVALRDILGDKVSDVRPTERLTETPACLVADEKGLDMQLERMLRLHQRLDKALPRVLEINPDHALIRAMITRAGAPGAAAALEEPAHLLLDMARVLEGDPLPDPAAFGQRLAKALTAALAN
ncbi:MAG: molecular chaperone HtpG [Alphaproteobacteria bacterium]|nr:MAG: molecular chaperone HtpG [Alphaproteobacteria bacterium]